MNLSKISKKIISFKWLILIVVFGATLFFGYQAKNLTIDADILRSLPEDDADARLLNSIGDSFGGKNMGIIILETDDIYQTSVIKHIQQLTDTVANIEGISSVSSLTNIINIKGGDYGIEVGTLVDEYDLPTSKEDFEDLKYKIASNEMYKGSIVSEDDTSTLIVFALEDEADINIVAKDIIQKTEALQLPEKLYYIGSPMLVTYISSLMEKDLRNLLPIAFLVIAIVLFLSFRSVIGVLLPLISAIIAIVWSLGTMAFLGYKMSMISNNIPIILLAVGSAYTIHVINRINQLNEKQDSNVISTALSYVIVPVILTAVTTMIGFVSFIFGAYLEMIVDFGIFTALGTFFACLLSILLVPSIMSLIPRSKPKQKNISKSTFIKDKLLIPLSNFLFKNTNLILTVWFVILSLSVFGIFSIKRSVDIQEYFKKDNPTRLAENIMVEKFGGTKPVFVLFEGDIQSPEVLNKMIKTSNFMKESPDINATMSVAKLISEINFAITGSREIPDSKEKIEQLWFLIDGNETLNRLVNEDLSQGIIISKFKSPENEAKIEFSKKMRVFIKENETSNIKMDITGMPFVDVTMDKSLIKSQLGSIIIAIFFVIIIVGIILRSLKGGVFTAIPIIAAIVILFGLMGLTGISLNIATVLVASVALGIGIDYSIHIYSHFIHSYKKNQEVKKAIQESILVSGNAIIINVISVSAGFLVLIFSEMVPLQYFGILIAISMLSSSIGALTLLPAILIKKHKK